MENVLIVAGGKGTRIKSSIPKQFIPLNGLPILMHTIKAFLSYDPNIPIVLVLPEDDISIWKDLCLQHHFKASLTLTIGGETRFQSVKKGLNKIPDHGLVAIHDGVRPLVSKDIIGASFRLAALHQSAIASVRLKDSIRIADQDRTRAVDRSQFHLVQTPQTFDIHLIKKAYELPEDSRLTDDASVAEKAGHCISLFEGSHENLKVTTQEDLVIAEALLKNKS